jgi:hypothetical protein
MREALLVLNQVVMYAGELSCGIKSSRYGGQAPYKAVQIPKNKLREAFKHQ